jgi:hypothetical protein
MKTDPSAQRTGLLHVCTTTVQATLFLVIVGGALMRMVGFLLYVADSGDEWGHTVAPFRVLYTRGDPNIFFHPSLYYYVTAAAYVGIFSFVKAAGVVNQSLSMTDLFVLEPRYFVFTARAVSVTAAVLTFGAVYVLARSLWRRQEGLTAAALLAILPAHVLYSKAVRVDSLFLLLLVVALLAVVQILKRADWPTYTKAGLGTGLATAGNYNGALLVPWLIAAHFLGQRDGKAQDHGTSKLVGALVLTAVTFFAASPFVVLNLETFQRNFAFISGLSVADHPGWEGRDFLFYARDLAHTNPYLCALIVVSSLAIALLGNRTARFVLSFPVAYVLVFSLIASKDARFILPAMPFFLVAASGLPYCLASLFPTRRVLRFLAYAFSWALYVPCMATMAAQSLPIQPHTLLSSPDAPLFDWIERNVPHRSKIAVESSIVNLLDTLKEDGPFTAALRTSIVKLRPHLDHTFIGLVYIGGCNYEPKMIADGEIDYAIISKRNMPYIESHCGEYPSVCEFYRQLRSNGRIVFETAEGFEPTMVYEIDSRTGPVE